MRKIVENTKFLLLLIAMLSVISISSLSYALYVRFTKKEAQVPTSSLALNDLIVEETEEVPEDTRFYIEVKGAVKKPGVYEVNADTMIKDAINLAGGLKSTAYTDNINLSKKVSSEMVIYVFTKSAYKKVQKVDTAEEVKNALDAPICNTSTYDIDNCTENGSSVIVPSNNDTVFNDSNTKEEVTPKLTNINTATTNELTNISGIGEAKAKSIIAYREEHGPFQTIEDIKKVSGIGDSLYEQIKNSITV